MDLASEAVQFGPFAFILVVVLLGVGIGGRWLVDKMIGMQREVNTVVQNNTEALTRLCDGSASTHRALAEHDQRAERVEAAIGQIGRAVDRTEAKVDRLAERMRS